MSSFLSVLAGAGLVLAMSPSGFATGSSDQDAVDLCIDQLRLVGGPDGQSGTVLSRSFSEAGTLVMLKDGGETVWRCIAYSDGSIGEISVVAAADDGGGAMAGAAPTTETVTVRFDTGSTGAELQGTLTPGSSARYVLGAAKEQFLSVRVVPDGPEISYQIFNPDQSFLLDQTGSDTAYRGQLWQTGDHVIEVINRGGDTGSYAVILGVE